MSKKLISTYPLLLHDQIWAYGYANTPVLFWHSKRYLLMIFFRCNQRKYMNSLCTSFEMYAE